MRMDTPCTFEQVPREQELCRGTGRPSWGRAKEFMNESGDSYKTQPSMLPRDGHIHQEMGRQGSRSLHLKARSPHARSHGSG